MKILGWAMTYWNDPVSAKNQLPGPLGLAAWEFRMRQLFSPIALFLSSGTWSDPRSNPLINVPIVNAGAIYDGPYEGHYRSYPKCAFTAAMAFALNRNDWDLLVMLDVDALLGDIDLNQLLREFAQRKEIMCCARTNCSYANNPEGPLTLWKREGASRLLHYRQCPNLLDRDEARRLTWDQECAYIYRDGR